MTKKTQVPFWLYLGWIINLKVLGIFLIVVEENDWLMYPFTYEKTFLAYIVENNNKTHTHT